MPKPIVVKRSFKAITKAVSFMKRGIYFESSEATDTESGEDIPIEIFVVNKCNDQRMSLSQSKLTTTSTSVMGDRAEKDRSTISELLQHMGMNEECPTHCSPREYSTVDVVRDIDMRKSIASDKESAANILHRNSTNKDAVIDALLMKIEHLLEVQRMQSEIVINLKAQVTQLTVKEVGQEVMDQTLDGQCSMHAMTKATQDESNGKLEAAMNSNTFLTAQVIFLKGANEHVTRLLSEKEAALEEARSTIAALMGGRSSKSDWSVETVPHSNKEEEKEKEQDEAATIQVTKQ